MILRVLYLNSDQIVESINVRNFGERKDRSSTKTRFGFLPVTKQRNCFSLAAILFLTASFLLLGLTIWLIQDVNNLRQDLQEIKTLFVQYKDGSPDSLKSNGTYH